MVVASKRTRIVCFRVTERELEWARAIAAENQQPLASVFRQAVGTYVADYAETVADGFPVNTPCAPAAFRMR